MSAENGTTLRFAHADRKGALTIMALASRLAERLGAKRIDPVGARPAESGAPASRVEPRRAG
jgi:hypothetical protein